MGNPNETAMFLPRPFPSGLTPDWKKYIIQGSTPNDTRLNFGFDQKARIPKANMVKYSLPSFSVPNTGAFDEDVDIPFLRIVTPKFPIWVEKVKICLHQETTYGCVKVNIWDYGSSESNIPTNIVAVKDPGGKTVAGVDNIPVTIESDETLISNALAAEDLYMVQYSQECFITPFDYTIAANSILRFGIQYAEGNAYGLKVFLIGWMLECDKVG